MQAKDVMTPDPKTCGPQDDLAAAIGIMREENCGIVPITEGNGDQRVVGVVTDRDIALHLGKTDARPSDVRVSDVMTTDIVSSKPDDDIREISRKMQQAQVRRILITEGKRLRGVVSTADLARVSAHSDDDEVGEEVEKVIEKVSEETSGNRPRT
jgi:CBS domain-containing protein